MTGMNVTGSGSTGATTGTTAPRRPAPAASRDRPRGSEHLDKDTFLKLLVAQLKYQDPTSPADATQFMAADRAVHRWSRSSTRSSTLDQKVLDASEAAVGRPG